MRIEIPSGQVVDLLPDQVADLLHTCAEALASLATVSDAAPTLSLRAPRTLCYDDHQARLTRIECNIVSCVLDLDSPLIDDLIDQVWPDSLTTDSTLRTHCANISNKLADARIPQSLKCNGGHVFFE